MLFTFQNFEQIPSVRCINIYGCCFSFLKMINELSNNIFNAHCSKLDMTLPHPNNAGSATGQKKFNFQVELLLHKLSNLPTMIRWSKILSVLWEKKQFFAFVYLVCDKLNE